MPPGPHVAHDDDPAQPLEHKVAHRLIVCDRQDRVREQPYFVSLVCNEAPHQEIVCRTVFDGPIAAESSQAGARRGNRRSQSKFHAVQLPCHQDASIEVRQHAYGLQMFYECGFVGRHVEARHRAYLGVSQRRNYRSQICLFGTNVAVVDYQRFVLRFIGKACQLRDLVVGGLTLYTYQHANRAVGKITSHLLDHVHDWIAVIAEAENDFVFRIVLLTETGEIFVSFVIETAHWLKDAYRRSEAGSGGERLTGAAEKSP